MEGDAGTSRLNPPNAEDSSDEVVAEAPAGSEEQASEEGSPSRISRGWMVGVCVLLVLLTAGVATGGYFAFFSHNRNEAAVRAEDEAVAAAKDCVAATNAPNPTAMAQSVQKIIDCSTGDFGAYAKMMAPMMVEAYQAANVQVEVTDMRAAAERHNPDGTIDVLVAFRFKVPSNPDQQGGETGLRLRAHMAPDDGTYKIAQLDPVMT